MPSGGPSTRGLNARGRIDRKLRPIDVQAICLLLKIIVESMHAQIKGVGDWIAFLERLGSIGSDADEARWAFLYRWWASCWQRFFARLANRHPWLC